ncbi:MAG: Crp/Fnr family transcriptional regulator [Chloroflexi bacterium]|nr:Crp/Fnr family transcriptional regulator [Chloroflexota bacterium]
MNSDSFLDNLDPALRIRLKQIGKPVLKRRGELIYASGDEGRTVWLVEEGRVRLYVLTVEGRKLVTAFVGAGGLIGEAALYGGPQHTTFAEAAADTRLLAVPAAAFRRLMLDCPALSLRVTLGLAERIRHAESSAESLLRQSASARMAALLLRLTRGEAGEVRGLAHQDLGDMIGVYRETATVILNQFRAAGMISLGILQLQVLAPTSLQAIAADPRRRARAN